MLRPRSEVRRFPDGRRRRPLVVFGGRIQSPDVDFRPEPGHDIKSGCRPQSVSSSTEAFLHLRLPAARSLRSPVRHGRPRWNDSFFRFIVSPDHRTTTGLLPCFRGAVREERFNSSSKALRLVCNSGMCVGLRRHLGHRLPDLRDRMNSSQLSPPATRRSDLSAQPSSMTCSYRFPLELGSERLKKSLSPENNLPGVNMLLR